MNPSELRAIRERAVHETHSCTIQNDECEGCILWKQTISLLDYIELIENGGCECGEAKFVPGLGPDIRNSIQDNLKPLRDLYADYEAEQHECGNATNGEPTIYFNEFKAATLAQYIPELLDYIDRLKNDLDRMTILKEGNEKAAIFHVKERNRLNEALVVIRHDKLHNSRNCLIICGCPKEDQARSEIEQEMSK